MSCHNAPFTKSPSLFLKLEVCSYTRDALKRNRDNTMDVEEPLKKRKYPQCPCSCLQEIHHFLSSVVLLNFLFLVSWSPVRTDCDSSSTPSAPRSESLWFGARLSQGVGVGIRQRRRIASRSVVSPWPTRRALPPSVTSHQEPNQSGFPDAAD